MQKYACLPWMKYRYWEIKTEYDPVFHDPSLVFTLFQNFDILFVVHFCTHLDSVKYYIRFIILDCWGFLKPLKCCARAPGNNLLSIRHLRCSCLCSVCPIGPWGQGQHLFIWASLSLLNQPLLSADILAQCNFKTIWWRVQILLKISWGR